MKTLFLLPLLLLAATFNSVAQDVPEPPPTSAPVAADAISKGNWLIGGSIASTGFNFDTDTYDLRVNPKAGYFIGENVAIGTELILDLTVFDDDTDFGYGIAPFVRYYFPELANPSGRFFQEGTVGIAGSNVEGSDDEPVSFLAGIRFGYAHFVARNVAIEGILGYTYTKADIDASTGAGGLGISLGLQIYLPGRGAVEE